VNGDGFADLMVGADHASPNGYSNSGSSFVIFGRASGFPASIALNGSNGFHLNGVAANDYSGNSVSTAGDVNGDGLADVITGASKADPNEIYGSGSSYLVFGQTSGIPPTFNLSTLNGINGFRFDGVATSDMSGKSVSDAGDINGDGFGDLIVGVDRANSSYVVFGGDFTGAVTQPGTSADDNLTGTAAAEHFVGGQGNDTLTGGGGADTFAGGSGDDTIQAPDLSFKRVDGGSGSDSLKLTGSGLSLDLATVRNRLSGLERIDITGSNTLTLSGVDVANLSDTSNTLTVDGDIQSTVTDSLGGWIKGADAGNYFTYAKGQAMLKINKAIGSINVE
jgi:hypothetical protein